VYVSQDGDTVDVNAVVNSFRVALQASVPTAVCRNMVHTQVATHALFSVLPTRDLPPSHDACVTKPLSLLHCARVSVRVSVRAPPVRARAVGAVAGVTDPHLASFGLGAVSGV
jgi:hypothetical protein